MKKKRRSLVGWVGSNNPMKFDGTHQFAELFIPPLYKTKEGLYFHEHATEHSKYLHNPRKVRITIEDVS